MEKIKTKNLIRLSKSCLDKEEKNAVMRVLDREYLGMGAEVQQFEKSLSDFFGRSALCVVNGTTALQLALEACGVGANDEVLVQSLTYVASFQAISAVRAKPVACDVNPTTMTIDLHDAEKRLTSRTKAIMPVHYGGGVGALDDIYAFAYRHNLRVIEDAAHAFGTSYREKRIGSFGDISCFSFDGIKNITSGEGGCITCADEQILRKVRDSRLLGVEKDSERRFIGERSWEFDVSTQGWRYHMSNIMASIGIEQLKKFQIIAKKRQSLASYYDLLLSKHKKIRIFHKDYSQIVPHIYVVRIPSMKNRELVRKNLLDFGVQTGIHYQPNHSLAYYRDDNIIPLSITDRIFPELLSLPLHPDLKKEDIKFVCKKLDEVLI